MVDLKQENVATSERPIRNPERRAKFVLNKCCFCIPLKTGCLVFAYLFLVGNVVSGLWSILAIVSNVMFFLQVSREAVVIIFLMINTASLVLDLVALSFNILLLVGLHKERRNYVRMFLIFQLVNIVVNILIHVFTISYGYATGIFIAISLAGDALNIYYLLVMRSQYVKLGEAIDKLPSQVYRDGRVEIMP